MGNDLHRLSEIVTSNQSVRLINQQFKETVEAKSAVQENVQTAMKKSRWICSVPLVLLQKLIDIYNNSLKKRLF